MPLLAAFTHAIDPVLGRVGPFYLWWYGFSYTAGFLGLFWWLRRARARLEMSPAEVYDLTLRVAAGVLLGGRLVEVFFYEWAYYGRHPWHIPAVWLGGMSTHGILLGGVIGLAAHCRRTKRRFLDLADALALPCAYIMGVGRIGNFIDGQIVGSLTTMPWGVVFPDLEGARHPVVLYDGLKNLLLIPPLLLLRRTRPPRGVVLGAFLFGYGFFRVFIDFFREYRSDLLGFPPGQEFNLLMTALGVVMVVRGYRSGDRAVVSACPVMRGGLGVRRVAFALLLALPLVIPSDWTQDVPARYGARHPGLEHSALYPAIAAPG